MAYRNSPALFQTVPSPTPYDLLFSKIGGSQLPLKNSIAIISGMAKATDFKFGWYIHIHRVHPNTSPLKILEKWVRGHIQGLPKFFWVPPIISGWVKIRTSNFASTFVGSIRTKAHLKFWESSRGRTQGLPNIFRALMYIYIYRTPHTVIFAIAQLSCLIAKCVFNIFLFSNVFTAEKSWSSCASIKSL